MTYPFTRSTYDAQEFATADEAFDAVPGILNGVVFQVARIGLGPFRYVIEIHKPGCAGVELAGYVKAA